jgi:transcription termination factor Rho
MNIIELKSMSTPQLADAAEALGIENAFNMRRARLVQRILERKLEAGETVTASGVFIPETSNSDYGFLRDPMDNFLRSDEDIYISPALIRRNNLRAGDEIEVEIKGPKAEDGRPERDRQGKDARKEGSLAAGRIITIHGEPPENNKNIPQFEDLTPLHPNRQMLLERPIKAEENLTGRLNARCLWLLPNPARR